MSRGRWEWADEIRGWVAFAPAVSARLETAYRVIMDQNTNTNTDTSTNTNKAPSSSSESSQCPGTVAIDNERFVDVAAMLQRRIDDPSKMRAVRRIAPNTSTNTDSIHIHTEFSTDSSSKLNSAIVGFAEGNMSVPAELFLGVVAHLKGFDSATANKLESLIESGGGLVAGRPGRRVTHTIVPQISAPGADSLLFPQEWVQNSIKAGKLLEMGDLDLSSSTSTSTSTSSSSSSSSSSSAELKKKPQAVRKQPTRKRKPSEEDEQQEEEEEEKEKAAAEIEEDEEMVHEEPEETGVQWMWLSDGGYLPYAAELNARVEAAFQADKKCKRFDIDAERFIDFRNMLQRRIDDPSKRRGLKRVDQSKQKKAAPPAAKKRKAASAAAKRLQDSDDDDDEGEEATSSSSSEAAAVRPNIKKVVKKGAAPVDVPSTRADTHHVYVDKASGVIWDCMLNQTNVGNNNNKFYVIQLLEHDTMKNSYLVWNRWGRVGLTGQGKAEVCASLDMAKSKFEKKFRDKTKNVWSNKASFKSKPGAYDLIEVSYSVSEDESAAAAASPKKKGSKLEVDIPDSTLDARQIALIELISDQKNMNKALIEMDIDTKKMPLGKLSKKQLNKGYRILTDIEDELKGKQRRAKLIDLSNQFYTQIPHAFGMRVPPIIDTAKLVLKKTEMLDSMANMEIAAKLMKAKEGEIIENPVDRTYKEIGVDITPIARGSNLWKTLEKNVVNTHGPTHKNYTLEVLDLFELVDHEASKKFQPFEQDKNRVLMWHGSRMTNWVGILSQGLRIAPPEAPVTGYMFGKGVYFADICSKSANYCHTNKKDDIGLMMLCEVALGDMYLKREAEMIKKLPPGKLSCKGEGVWMPDPSDTGKTDTGCVVPYGAPVQSGLQHIKDTQLLYNEFIVYDTAQIKPVFLLKLKFHYK